VNSADARAGAAGKQTRVGSSAGWLSAAAAAAEVATAAAAGAAELLRAGARARGGGSGERIRSDLCVLQTVHQMSPAALTVVQRQIHCTADIRGGRALPLPLPEAGAEVAEGAAAAAAAGGPPLGGWPRSLLDRMYAEAASAANMLLVVCAVH